MAKVRLEVFEDGAKSATITVPAWMVAGAMRILPKIAGASLEDHVDLEQIAALVRDPHANGVLLDIIDHDDNERVIISIVGDEP